MAIVVFASREEADGNVRNLMSRCTRVDETDTPANYKWLNGKMVAVK